MLRSLKPALILALAIASLPVGISTSGLVDNTASAVATYRTGAMKPHSTRSYTAAGELRVCNEGPVPVRLYISNSLTDQPTDSMLEPGRCNHLWTTPALQGESCSMVAAVRVNLSGLSVELLLRAIMGIRTRLS